MAILTSAVATIGFVAKSAAGVMIARTIGKGLISIGERIFPYEKTKAYKQTAQSLAGQRELERMREEFQDIMQAKNIEANREIQAENIKANRELQAKNIEANREIQAETIKANRELHAETIKANRELQAETIKANRELQAETTKANRELALFNQMFNRQTNMLIAEINTYNSLRHALIQDAIRNFPLNISPLVLLENNNIDISFLLGNKGDEMTSVTDSMWKIKPINVFITPMHVDTRVGGKEILAAQVYDSVYSSLETVFVNEYSRNGERPIIFYSTAWNKNVKGGLHAAEEIFYFLKDMPTIVVEPRFDGKCVKILFSCWGIGYSNGIHCRQELQLPLDLNSMLAISAFERSEKALSTLSEIESPSKMIQDQINMHKHNVKIFKDLNLESRIEKRLKEISEKGHSDELEELGDFSKMMYISQDDVIGLSDVISSALGMMISTLSDTHHLLANDVAPRFPYIYKKYFGEYVNRDLLKVFSRTYEQAYLKLKKEFPLDEDRRLVQKEKVMNLLEQSTNSNGGEDILYAMKQRCKKLGLMTNNFDKNLSELIDYYITHYDGDEEFVNNLIPFMSDKQRGEIQIKMTDRIY